VREADCRGRWGRSRCRGRVGSRDRLDRGHRRGNCDGDGGGRPADPRPAYAGSRRPDLDKKENVIMDKSKNIQEFMVTIKLK
jgi:hypothetical protein